MPTKTGVTRPVVSRGLGVGSHVSTRKAGRVRSAAAKGVKSTKPPAPARRDTRPPGR